MKSQILVLIIMLVAFSSTGVILAQNVEYVGSTLWTDVNDVKVIGDYAY